ncbi:hypothetical protein F1559_003967 [Cyanidiococcus yangmingshanensis]|uniref:Uncharacterized protein n=1 Tax=Cyanidiococcus yangmingshanensis TaxID=2690220 RepID=A0A7J7IH31_9RHOD|nr:hypothetical protein F1559_003967 [Cyanidiococcus yangmingshanensis]
MNDRFLVELVHRNARWLPVHTLLVCWRSVPIKCTLWQGWSDQHSPAILYHAPLPPCWQPCVRLPLLLQPRWRIQANYRINAAQVLLTSTDNRLLRAVAELLCSGVYAGAQAPTWPRPPFRPFPPKVHPSGRLLVGIGATGLRVGTPVMALLQRLQQLTEWPLAALATPLFQLLLGLLQAPDVISLLGPFLLSQNELTERSVLTQWLRLLSSEAFVGLARLDRACQVPLLMGSVLECTALVVHCADMERTLGSLAGGGTPLTEITRGMARELLDRLVTPLLRRILILDAPSVAAEAMMTPLGAWHKLVAACFERLLSTDSEGLLEWGADAATLTHRCLELAMEIAGGSESRMPATSSIGTLPGKVLDAGGASALFTIIHCCRILWRVPTWSKPDTTKTNVEHAMACWANPTEERTLDAPRSSHEQVLDRIANLCVTVATAMQERSIATETRLLLYAVQCALMDLLTPMSWPMSALDAPALVVEWNCQPEDRVRWTRVHVSKWVRSYVHAASKLEHQASSWVADATANGETALRAMVLATLTQALQLGASLAGVPVNAAPISAPEAEATPKTRQIELFSPNKLAHVLMITDASALARGGLDPLALDDRDADRDARETAPALIAIRQLYLYEQHLSFFNQIAATAWTQGSVLRMLPDLSEALHAWVAQGVESGLLLFPEVPLPVRVAKREANRRRLALARRMAMLATQLAQLLPTGMPSLAPSWRFLALCAIRLGSVWLATRSIATPETCLPVLQLAKWYGRLLCSLPEAVFVEHRELDTLRHSFVLQYLKLFPRRTDTESDLDSANGAQTPLVVGTAPWDAAGPFATPLLVASVPRWHRAHDPPSIVTRSEEATSTSPSLDPDLGNLLVSSYRLIRLELLRIILDLNMNCATPSITFPGLSEMIENANATPIGQSILGCAGTAPPQRRMRAEHVSLGLLWLVSECVSSDRAMKMRGNASHVTPPASVATPTTCPSWARERQHTYEAALYRELLERSLWFLLAVFEPSSSAGAMVWPLSRTRTRPWVDWLYEELEKQRADSSWMLCRLLVRRIRQWIPASDLPMTVSGSEREQLMASS